MLAKYLLGGSQPSSTYVEDVFSAYTYTGTSKVRHITTGVPSKGTAAMSGTSFVGPTASYPRDVCFDGTDMYLLINYGSSADLTLVKMNSSFSVVWQRKVTGGAGATYSAVRIGESNNVYVGFDYTSGNKSCLGKWDSSGNLQWIKDFTYYAGAHYVLGMAVDSSGNSYLCGQKAASGSNEGYLVKFNSSGTIQWGKTFTYHSDYATKCGCVAIAANGDIIVGGYFYSSSIGGAAFIASFTSAGVKNWDHSVTQIGTFIGICTDNSSNVYVTTTQGYVVCYNSSGAYQSGSSFLLGPGGGINSVFGCLQLGSDGYLYLQVSPTYNKWEVYRINGSTILSSSQFVTGTAYGPSTLVVNGSNVYVLGLGITTNSDGFVLKFDRADIGNLHANFANGCAVIDATPYTVSSPTLTRDQNLVQIFTTSPTVTANSAFTEAAASVSFTNISVASQSSQDSLVWIKARTLAQKHLLMDTKTLIGTTVDNKYRNYLDTSVTNGFQNETTQDTLLGMTSTGFALGDATTDNYANNSSYNYIGWTFRKAAKFFDIVTYTGTGSARTISHSLGQIPGMIVVKCTSTTGNWAVYHQNHTSAAYYTKLNLTDAETSDSTVWNSTAPTASVFSVGTNALVNTNGATYVAYLFGHDTTSTGLVQCGGFTTDGSGNATVTLGWEPQFVMIKMKSSTGNWTITDSARSMTATTNQQKLLWPNLSSAESTNSENAILPTATGFRNDTTYLGAGNSYIYLAIRRGPMKAPTSGTQVYNALTWTGSGAISSKTGLGFPPDLAIGKQRTVASNHPSWMDRSRGANIGLLSTGTAAEVTNTAAFNSFDMDGFTLGADGTQGYWNYGDGGSHVGWCFRRAPGFFDIVCYRGTGVAKTETHNLGVVPELIIVKQRSGAGGAWGVYVSSLGATKYLSINNTDAANINSSFWDGTAPTTSVFSIGANVAINTSGANYVAYLFASKAGLSKVGSYTGNGSNQTIDCGFSSGARFVLIKRTDSTEDWFVWDTARGIIAANDPYMALNRAAVDDNNGAVDSIDPDSSGFIVNQDTTNNINVNTGTYVYLAIA